ncbi:RES family NAD+ phosphorylase [Halomonas sp.]|jgi:RES domain-containing protein|uniref:RES family NAD+ phosphorylase n=1 Tax=Halomonas sp. TaxID=1486246 RepID=UPI00356970C7
MRLTLFRVAPKRFIDNLSGLGGSYHDGGRWNEPGHPALYFGTSASVALLEMGHYIPAPRQVPRDFVMGTYEVETDAIDTVDPNSLPEDWDRFPYPASTQAIGTDFLVAGKHLVLLAPSAAACGIDQIAVVNPNHPDLQRLCLVQTRDQLYNPRLFQGLK